MKFIFRFFVVLGVIFFCLLSALGYFIVADPYNLRPLVVNMYQNSKVEKDETTLFNQTNTQKVSPEGNSAETSSGVSSGQAQALESVGMDASNVPAKFTPEQTNCFVNILGSARVEAIKAGATPSATEFFQAKACL